MANRARPSSAEPVSATRSASSRASCSAVKTSVWVAGDFRVNQAGSRLRLSKARTAWLRPRGVHRNRAQPPFSARIGRR